MKKKLTIISLALLSITLFSCSSNKGSSQQPTSDSSIPTTTPIVTSNPLPTSTSTEKKEEGEYEAKFVNFYRTKDDNGKNVVDRKISLRFYSDQPNVPYIGVKGFYKEFYKTNLTVTQDKDYYTFKKSDNSYLKIDTYNDLFCISNILDLSDHPDFASSNSKTFSIENEIKRTTSIPFGIDLKKYNMPIYKSNLDAYVPFQFISNIFSGVALFNIAYNEKDLYEYDYNGELSNSVPRNYGYYGDSYNEIIDSDTERKEDLIKFNYNLLCLHFDNLRGYTSQLALLDNNLLSLGLNGTLEKYCPEIKELLFSKNRKEYKAGMLGLFSGLSDGGHTALNALNTFLNDPEISAIYRAKDSVYDLLVKGISPLIIKQTLKQQLTVLRKNEFGNDIAENYYKYDGTNKISYIGFDKFVVNYDGWDEYYTRITNNETGTIPDDDTYSYIRSKLYQSLDDGAETVVLDLSTNGGGDTLALMGLVGLFNGGKVKFSSNNVAEKTRREDNCKIDINLDGKYDNSDLEESGKFTSMNIVLLTSQVAFSCGNLFPSLMKELGYKTIGDKTSGGSCAIMYETSGDGITYVRSSFFNLTNTKGENVDSGVPVDYNLVVQEDENGVLVNKYNKFYDMAYVASLFK